MFTLCRNGDSTSGTLCDGGRHLSPPRQSNYGREIPGDFHCGRLRSGTLLSADECYSVPKVGFLSRRVGQQPSHPQLHLGHRGVKAPKIAGWGAGTEGWSAWVSDPRVAARQSTVHTTVHRVRQVSGWARWRGDGRIGRHRHKYRHPYRRSMYRSVLCSSNTPPYGARHGAARPNYIHGSFLPMNQFTRPY